MTEDVDRTDLLLRLLRDNRGNEDEHSRQLAEHPRRFSEISRRIDEVHKTMCTTLGLAGHADIRHDAVAERLESAEQRPTRLEEKADAD